MKQETLEEAAEKYARKQCDDMYNNEGLTGASWGWETSLDFTEGAKWQQEQIGKSEFLQRLRGTLSDAEARRLIFETFKNK